MYYLHNHRKPCKKNSDGCLLPADNRHYPLYYNRLQFHFNTLASYADNINTFFKKHDIS